MNLVHEVSTFNFFARAVTIAAFIIWRLYWNISGIEANKKKTKTKLSFSLLSRIQKYGSYTIYYLIVIQLCGLSLFPITQYEFTVQIIGFILVVLGILVMLIARKQLGLNWTNSHEYQIKQDHDLVIKGIYRYIRHPIYIGITMLIVGSELVAVSYFYLIFFIILLIALYRQGKQEETLLTNYFGNEYKNYMRHTKMFIPHIF